MIASAVFDFFFSPHGQPWWMGNAWGNVAAVVPCAILAAVLGLLWSKTSYWPLNAIHERMDRIEASHRHNKMLMEEIHHKLSTGVDHPRVTTRLRLGQHPTPDYSASTLERRDG